MNVKMNNLGPMCMSYLYTKFDIHNGPIQIHLGLLYKKHLGCIFHHDTARKQMTIQLWICKWTLSSVQLTGGSTKGETERNKSFPRKVCNYSLLWNIQDKHCLNRNGGMHFCAACQEGNYTLMQSSDSHSWSLVHKKHTGTVLSRTQAVCPTQNTDL